MWNKIFKPILNRLNAVRDVVFDWCARIQDDLGELDGKVDAMQSDINEQLGEIRELLEDLSERIG